MEQRECLRGAVDLADPRVTARDPQATLYVAAGDRSSAFPSSSVEASPPEYFRSQLMASQVSSVAAGEASGPLGRGGQLRRKCLGAVWVVVGDLFRGEGITREALWRGTDDQPELV